MTDEMERLIDSYYEDSIELSDHKILLFKRIQNYKCTDRLAVKVSIEDLETETTIELGIYFDAKWIFNLPMSERIFWYNAKIYWNKVKEVFNRMREPIPVKEVHVYKIRFRQASDRATSRLERLTSIFKDEEDGKITDSY